MMRRLKLASHALWLITGLLAAAIALAYHGRASYIGYEQAGPILEALRRVLPPELRSLPAQNPGLAWDQWVAARDQQIRARLERGDEDSLVNFLLFGTSFTNKKRLTLEFLADVGRKQAQMASSGSSVSPEGAELIATVSGRADDLINKMQAPGTNERLGFARRFIEKKGYSLAGPAARDRVKEYLLASFARVLNEHASYAETLENARKNGDVNEEFAERSRLYRERGLSSDTSLLPDFAIAEALRAMKTRALLTDGQVRRVAVVGPGLDFTDKQDGYDFYPQQTVQPFAIVDSLLRLGLASPQGVFVTTLDISPRINDHLARAAQKARRGIGYTVQLPFEPGRGWKPELTAYWKAFGDRIGSEAHPGPVPPAFGDIRLRAVRVRPQYVSRISPVDLNIVLQRLELGFAERFDVIIATNILVYYDTFEQSLALANIAAMLKPSGFLLSNNGLAELPAIPMHSVGYQTVIYSDRPGDGDHIVWYQRQ